MPVEIIDCEQNSEEWYRARMGLPTASEFSTILAQGRGGKPSKTRATYLNKIAGEIITQTPAENYSNAYMERGHALQEEAVRHYETLQNCETGSVGFLRNGRKGASPDRLIGDDGLLEIKTQAPHLLIERILSGKFPPEHKAQCQGQLWVAEREWLDIGVYYPGMPLFLKRVTRDEPYIVNLAAEVARFNEEVDEIIARVQAYNPFERAA